MKNLAGTEDVQTKTKAIPPGIKFKDLFENREYFLMLLPGLINIIIFNYLPLLGLVIAFKNIDYSKGVFGSDWIGLYNFEFLFKSPDVIGVLRNTILYNLTFIVTGILIPVTFAIMLSMMLNKRMARLYQSLMFLPYFLSWIIISYLVFSLFDYRLGMINNGLLKVLNIAPIRWYQSPQYWPAILILLNIWKICGYNSVIYLAAIMGIDSELYEAAAIDGANKWQQTLTITLPGIQPIMIILSILAVGKIFNSDFGMFYNVPMNSGSLLPVTNVMDTFVYNALKINGDIGMSSAAGFFQSIVGFILVLTTNFIVRKIDDSQALF